MIGLSLNRRLPVCFLLVLISLSWVMPISASDLSQDIESLLALESVPEAVKPFRDFDLLKGEVTGFSRSREFEPAWVVEGQLSQKAITILGALEISDSHGLRPGDYLAGVLSPGMALVGSEPVDGPTLARIDVGLSATGIRCIKDLHEGRFSPQQLKLGLDITHRQLDLAAELERVSQAADPALVLDGYAPQHEGYFRLREELAYYRRLAAKDEWRPLESAQAVRPGDAYPQADLLRRRLRLTRDLEADAATVGPVYDDILAAAVKRFQERHGLPVDGENPPR